MEMRNTIAKNSCKRDIAAAALLGVLAIVGADARAQTGAVTANQMSEQQAKPQDDIVWQEAEFLNTLARRTGCLLLVDVNNIYVNALNDAPAGQPAEAAPDHDGPGFRGLRWRSCGWI